MVWWVEMIGYIGVAFLILAFLCKNMTLLRILDIIGCAFSLTYGFLTKTYPTATLNIVLLVINFLMLLNRDIKSYKDKKKAIVAKENNNEEEIKEVENK